MALEIERKFIVNDLYRQAIANCKSSEIIQGYLSTNPQATVRVRIVGNSAFITVKTRNLGCVRHEWEYSIPHNDAIQMLQQCHTATVSKTRYYVPIDGLVWEIDIFHGHNSGLVLAEVELPTEDCTVKLPPFIDREVTGDPRFYNSNLIPK